MFRENQRTLTALNILYDGLILVLSLCLAFLFRFHVMSGDEGHAGLSYYVVSGILISPFFLLLYGLFGLYDEQRSRTFYGELELLIPANLIGTVLLIAAFFLIRNVDISRMTIAIFFIFSTVLIGMRRFLLRRFIQNRRVKGFYLKQVLLIGSGQAAENYLAAIKSDPSLGVRIIKCVSDAPPPAGISCHGTFAQLEQILLDESFDEVVAALSLEDAPKMGDIIFACEKNGTRLSLLPFYYEHMPARAYMDEIAGLPLINLRRIPLDNVALAFLKRLFDIVGSILLIILSSPIMLLAAIGTRLASPGPVIFRQERVGRDKKPFMMYKMRTMRANEREQNGWTSRDDQRRTAFGSFLRKFSLDELPQLINVIRGDMSLVGPRPEVLHFVEQFRESVPLYMVKHQVRPGMTGWAQVNGLRGDTSIPDRIRHDIWYIENWSLLLDMRILLMTLFCGFISTERIVKTAKTSNKSDAK